MAGDAKQLYVAARYSDDEGLVRTTAQFTGRRSCAESDIGEPNSYRRDYLGVMMISTAASGPRTSLSPA